MPDPTAPRSTQAPKTPWRHDLHTIIFEADTPAGKLFDVVLLVAILASIAAVSLESVTSIGDAYGPALRAAEWVFTILFTIEYLIRLATVRHPMRYARSFFGIVDLLSVLPTYISLLVGGSQALAVVRGLRLLRVFRVLKMARYVGESQLLFVALRHSRPKITVFLVGVMCIVVIVGALMYLIEGTQEGTGFTSIPQSVYWAIVTMTTVGYGDISPTTLAGKTVASAVMILGYAIIAVPTGIVSAEIAQLTSARRAAVRACRHCAADDHDDDARHCKHCGAELTA
jgi:voltage-gated potassium channel